jgi:putative ABC transport system permease protein
MRILQLLRMRLRALFRSAAVDADLDEEMRAHLDRLVDEHVGRGLTPAAARAAARREFGPTTQLTEEAREARGVAWLVTGAQDVIYGVRLMRRAPGFAAAAILTIAIGIGATTAMFSVVYGVLLRPLPFGDADRLVYVWSAAPSRGLARAYVAMANVYDYKARNHVFDDIGAVRAIANFNLTGPGGEPERLLGGRLAANVLPLLRVAPMLGRAFTEDEDEIGHEQVAILSYGLWRRRFGGDPSIVGQSISLSGVPHTVVGVMGPDFAFPSRDYQIWTPLTFDPGELVTRLNYSYLAVARLKPGVSLAQARSEMDVIAAQIVRDHPKEAQGIGVAIAPMLADTIAPVRTPLYILLAAVLAMLLIGCANLANLLLSRALARQRELAVRAALGAGRARLVVQSIAEVVPLAAAGGAVGVAIATWTIGAVVPLLPPDLPRAENIAIHAPVLAFAVAMVTAITVLVGVWPALDASRSGLATAMSDLSRGVTSGVGRARTRDLLAVGQIAVTLWLAIGASLLMRSLAELKQVSPGFTSDRVYTLHVAIPRTKYRTDRDVAAFMRRILDRVDALPGVVAAGMVNRLPLAGGAQTAPIEFEGIDASVLTPGLGLQSDIRPVTPDYFRALQIPLVDGRVFTEADTDAMPAIAIIDDRAARIVFRGASPIGRRLRVAIPNQPWLAIVGVVGHVRHDRLDDDGRPQVYWSYKQNTQDREALVVRTAGDPAALAQSIAAAIRSVDPEQPIYDARTLDDVVDRSLGQRRLQTTLLVAFATIGVLLASIGVYGVMAFGVGQRTREFGIRLALGARRGEIVTDVMRRGAILFAYGGAIGLSAAALSARVMRLLLFNVGAFDVVSFASATVVLAAATVAACSLPARRAAAVDPSLALRVE